MLDHPSLKAMAKRIGRPVTDLLALAPQNDPFYAGSGARARSAEWFASVWTDHGAADPHLRRLHYRIVSLPLPIKLPNGKAFQNTENDWQFLVTSSLAARYLGLVSIDVDRRNAAPMLFAPTNTAGEDISCGVGNEWAAVDVPDMPPLPSVWISGLDDDDAIQEYIVEVWIEKSTQNDWLEPLCRRREVNLVVGIGEQSEVRSRELAMRAAKYGKPVRVIYISDFDPGGRSMPKAVARKVEFTIAKLVLDVDLQLIPLALTPEQCHRYQLSRIPIKETERRRDKFEQIFGVGATELDALEAIYPGELGRLLEVELNGFLDPNLKTRVERKYFDIRLPTKQLEKHIHEKYADEVNALSERFEEIKEQLDDWETEASDLWHTISNEIEEVLPDLSDVAAPQSEAPGETSRFVLFDSKRDYFTQMDAYNAWRDGDEFNDPDGSDQ
jgi:hypothetical protein